MGAANPDLGSPRDLRDGGVALQAFSGWTNLERRLLIAGFVNCAISSGLIQSFTVFFVALIQEMGWTRAATASILSIGLFVIGLTSTLGGYLLSSLGPRRLMVAASVVAGTGLILASRSGSLLEFYLTHALLFSIGISMLGWIVQGAVLAPHYAGTRGLAIGLAYGGQGLGVLTFVFLTQYLIDHWGWRTAMAGMGAGTVVVGAVINYLLQPPTQGYAGAPVRIEPEVSTWSRLRAAMGTPPFWAFGAVLALSSSSVYGMANHQAAFLVDMGYSASVGAAVISVGGLLSTIGRAVFGLLSDRVGQLQAGTLSFMVSMLAFGILAFSDGLPVMLLVIYTLLFGLSFGARAPIMSSLAAEEFGGPAHGTIWGVMTLANNLGVAVGGWLIGLVFDTFGTYRAVFQASLVILLLSNLALLLGVRASRKLSQRLSV